MSKELLKMIGRRLGVGLLTLILTSIVVFLVLQTLPGNVGRTVLGPYATNAQVSAYDHTLGLDRPIFSQYFHWLQGFVSGNWGQSYVLRIPVRSLVISRLGHSLILGATAFIICVPLSLATGIAAGSREDRTLDRTSAVIGLSLIAIPEFISGSVLILIFSITFRIFPSVAQVPTTLGGLVKNLLLPSVALSTVLFGYISKIARSGTVEVVNSNYYRTAVLKGLPSSLITRSHVLKNALTPSIGVLAVQAGWLVGGLVVIETLFNYPGIGQLMLTSATGHDIPTLEACVILSAMVYTLANILGDVIYYLVDPRVRRMVTS